MFSTATQSHCAGALRTSVVSSDQQLRGSSCRPIRRHAAAVVQVRATTVDRLARVGRAYTASWGDKVVSSMERPDVMMDQVVRDMQKDTVSLRKALAQVSTTRLQLQKQVGEGQKAENQWSRRAEIAVAADKDDLARHAIRQRRAEQEHLSVLHRQLSQVNTAYDSLRSNLRTMQSRTATALQQAPTLKARYAAAKASEMIASSFDSFTSRSDTAFAAIARAEDKISALECEAQHFLPQVMAADMALESRFDRLREDEMLNSLRMNSMKRLGL